MIRRQVDVTYLVIVGLVAFIPYALAFALAETFGVSQRSPMAPILSAAAFSGSLWCVVRFLPTWPHRAMAWLIGGVAFGTLRAALAFVIL